MTHPPCLRLCPANPGNPRNRIEGESPLQGKGHTAWGAAEIMRVALGPPPLTHKRHARAGYSITSSARATGSGYFKAECFRSLEIDHELKLGGLYHPQVGRPV